MNYELLVRLHVLFGVASLLSFWLQMALRKGGVVHRAAGRTYAGAMSGVILTAIPIGVILTLGQHWGAGLVLGFLAWITLSAGVGGVLAAVWRDRKIELQWRVGRVFSWGLLLISLGLLAMIPLGGIFVGGLGVFGVWASIADLRTTREAHVWRSWLARHLEGMLGTGIAVHVAFLVFGLRSLLGDAYTNTHFLLGFTVPTLLGMFAASRLSARFAPDRRAAGPPTAATAAD